MRAAPPLMRTSAVINDTAPRCEPAAANQAYAALLEWFERHVTWVLRRPTASDPGGPPSRGEVLD